MACIYLITNRVNGKRYVGQTRQSPDLRWRQHKNSASSARNVGCMALNRAIRKHSVEFFDFSIVQECSSDLVDEREIYWINEYATVAPGGYNLTLGGEAGRVITQETRDKISAANRLRSVDIANRNRSPEMRAATSAANKNRTPEEIARIAKIRWPNGAAKRRAPKWAGDGKYQHSAETKAKISATKKQNMSDETRAKIKAARARQAISAEHIEKIRIANTGRVMSAESRAKLSASRKALFANRTLSVQKPYEGDGKYDAGAKNNQE